MEQARNDIFLDDQQLLVIHNYIAATREILFLQDILPYDVSHALQNYLLVKQGLFRIIQSRTRPIGPACVLPEPFVYTPSLPQNYNNTPIPPAQFPFQPTAPPPGPSHPPPIYATLPTPVSQPADYSRTAPSGGPPPLFNLGQQTLSTHFYPRPSDIVHYDPNDQIKKRRLQKAKGAESGVLNRSASQNTGVQGP